MTIHTWHGVYSKCILVSRNKHVTIATTITSTAMSKYSNYLVFMYGITLGVLTTIYVFNYSGYSRYQVNSGINHERFNMSDVLHSKELSPLITRNDSSILQYGRVEPGRRYAVFSSSFSGDVSVNYAFDLPLSVLAWRRVGFDSLVMLSGDFRQYVEHAWLRHLVDVLRSMDHVVLVVVKVTPAHSQSVTTISQVSRLLAASLVPDHGDDVTWLDTYLLTADADIWGLRAGYLDLPADKDIIHAPTVMGTIRVTGVDVTHIPLSYVGMRVATWLDVMSHSGRLKLPTTSDHIVDFYTSLFGEKCCDDVKHGGPGWNTDEDLISLRIHQWKNNINNPSQKQTKTNSNSQKQTMSSSNQSLEPHSVSHTDLSSRIHVYVRHVTLDRLDRFAWPWLHKRFAWPWLHKRNVRTLKWLDRFVDAHILIKCYVSETWAILRPLLKLMYPNDSNIVTWCDQYAQSFRQLLL